jgi:RNA polymerase sigma factor (sigma-70 family)
MASQTLVGLLRYLCRLGSTNASDEQSDARLLQQFVAQRDEAAFATLLERHGPLVLGVCRHVLGNTHDTEDAFQATFLILARKAASIRRQQSLAAWLHRVAANVSRTARANASRRRAHERQAALLAQPTPAGDEAFPDWRPLLHEEVDRLPEKYRVPIVLCYLEGQTHDQAARQLGWPLGTVKGRLARARHLLRARLARRGLTLSAGALGAALAQGPAPAAVPAALLALTLRAALAFAARGAVPGGGRLGAGRFPGERSVTDHGDDKAGGRVADGVGYRDRCYRRRSPSRREAGGKAGHILCGNEGDQPAREAGR